jgi:pentatricopeptide repeat protein
MIIGRGLLKEDMVLGAALMDMYAKHGMLARAREVLEELMVRDVVVWNVLIAGYARQGQCHEASNCLSWLSCAPDEATFICILSACGKIGAVDKGKQIHAEIVRRGLLETSLVLGNGLVDMYAKCGMLSKARQILDELPTRDVVSWNSLIAGYAQYGHGHEVLNCFEWMQCEGLDPDEVTCVCVLAACCRSGLVDEAEAILAEMGDKYGIAPSLELCTYMVAILGCIGRFDKALSMIEALRYAGYATVWVALLGACSKWGNAKLAKLAFDRAVQIDRSCAAAYVIMANIFAALGMQEEARNVKAMRLEFCL